MDMTRRTTATGFLRDFQAFIMRGNVVELAVAVVLGGAFGKVVEAFVNWLMSVALKPVLEAAKVDQLKDLPFGLGDFAIAIVNFIIVALVIFVLIRRLEKFMRKQEADAPIDPVVESQERLTVAVDRLADTLNQH
jgi:large conductance mechanosensitive channel